MNEHNALYYPFSRCLDMTALKQFLLLFDSVTFVDPVDDDEWRGELFRGVEDYGAEYRGYRDLAPCMPWLRQTGIIRIQSPESLSSLNDGLTTAAALSDLQDSRWAARVRPEAYGLPLQRSVFTNKPCWNIFSQKMPRAFVDALYNEDAFAGHVINNGGDQYAWELSYAAGSAVGINVHLAAAEELGLAPVTDSPLHHELMLMKLARNAKDGLSSLEADAYAERLADQAIFRVFGQLLKPEDLEQLPLEDVIRFRMETDVLRKEFVAEIKSAIIGCLDPTKLEDHFVEESKIVSELLTSAKTYSNELLAVRDKLLPKFIGGITSPAASVTSGVGLAASFITSSGHVLAASLVLAALAPVKALLEWKADLSKAERSASSGVAYLSRVKALARP